MVCKLYSACIVFGGRVYSGLGNSPEAPDNHHHYWLCGETMTPEQMKEKASDLFIQRMH